MAPASSPRSKFPQAEVVRSKREPANAPKRAKISDV